MFNVVKIKTKERQNKKKMPNVGANLRRQGRDKRKR